MKGGGGGTICSEWLGKKPHRESVGKKSRRRKGGHQNGKKKNCGPQKKENAYPEKEKKGKGPLNLLIQKGKRRLPEGRKSTWKKKE